MKQVKRAHLTYLKAQRQSGGQGGILSQEVPNEQLRRKTDGKLNCSSELLYKKDRSSFIRLNSKTG